MRIDAHQHFWTYDRRNYGWIGEGMEVLAQDFGAEDLRPLLGAARLDSSIVVQARHDLAESDELLEIAAAHEHLIGVVAWVDLESDVVGEELDRRLGAKLLGIRHLLQDEEDDRHMLRPAFQRGIVELTKRKLAYDLLLHPRHLPIALELVDNHPEQTFILDHLAKPKIASGQIDDWCKDLKRLSLRPQVAIKLSGLVTEADWGNWTAEDLWPYLDAAFEAFGPERVMFGSDWPVCLLAASYNKVVDVVQQWSEGFSSAEQHALWGGNAARLYRVNQSSSIRALDSQP